MRVPVSLRLSLPSQQIPVSMLSNPLMNPRERAARITFRREEADPRVEQLKEITRRRNRGGRQINFRR